MGFEHIVVWDGTSCYVIPSTDLKDEIKKNNVKVLKKFKNFDKANEFCEIENEFI